MRAFTFTCLFLIFPLLCTAAAKKSVFIVDLQRQGQTFTVNAVQLMDSSVEVRIQSGGVDFDFSGWNLNFVWGSKNSVSSSTTNGNIAIFSIPSTLLTQSTNYTAMITAVRTNRTEQWGSGKISITPSWYPSYVPETWDNINPVLRIALNALNAASLALERTNPVSESMPPFVDESNMLLATESDFFPIPAGSCFTNKIGSYRYNRGNFYIVSLKERSTGVDYWALCENNVSTSNWVMIGECSTNSFFSATMTNETQTITFRLKNE